MKFNVTTGRSFCYTLALIVPLRSRWAPLLLVIPVGWLVMSAWSGWLLGIWQDPVIAAVGLAMLVLPLRPLLRRFLLGFVAPLAPGLGVRGTPQG